MIVVVQYDYLPERTDERLAARPAHREWETRLKADGLLVQGGPFEDGVGAMLVFDVPDEATLDELLAADPYPKDTFVVASRRRWTTLFDFGR